MISRIKKHEPQIGIKAADAITRINKDIRFSKDKTPYNTHVGANISVYGKKDKSYPGFYFQLSHEKPAVYGGAYAVEPPTLEKIRRHIAANPSAFAKAYATKAFKEKYGTLQGEQQKRLPEEFKAIAGKEPLIANKQFYFTSLIDPKIITTAELPDRLMEYYLAGKDVNVFLRGAF
jgi:uncharacterized protein (TIGR02453 family)